MRGWWSSLLASLGGLRRLSQPYFLPLEAGAVSFALLLAALVAVVVGLSLLLLTAALAFSSALIPDWQARFLPGVAPGVMALWQGPIGWTLLGLAAAGAVAFWSYRGQLRQGRWQPWLLLGLIVLLILVINGINVAISFIARHIDNALVNHQSEAFWRIVAIYGLALMMALPIRASQFYLIPRVGVLWRQWLSQRLLALYLCQRAYYSLNAGLDAGLTSSLISGRTSGRTDGPRGRVEQTASSVADKAREIDNPDQRISQDTASFTGTSLSVAVGILEAVLSFFSFIVVLWTINSHLALLLIIYAVFGTALVLLASGRLVALNGEQLRLEADFRYGLVRLRDNAESIAFYRGEAREGEQARQRLGRAISNAQRLITWEALIGVIQSSYNDFSNFLPWLVIAPLYFARQVDFGVFGQAGIAFSQVLASVSFLVNNIDRLAAFSASIQRLESFQSEVESLALRPALAAPPGQRQQGRAASAGAIRLSHVQLTPPGSDRPLIGDLSFCLEQGERLLVMGPSGCGKTSLLRLVSGLWPLSSGQVQRPPVGELMFIPQKPYMLLGSLREQLCYPQDPVAFSDDQLRHVLGEVLLPDLLWRYPDLEIRQDWPRLLSLGEQQRLAFARLLLCSPRFVVLDEATSALDGAAEQLLYAQLLRRRMGLISVGHRPSLRLYHDRLLELDGRGGWRLGPLPTP
ncbi:MAG: ABC transporter ATP-binding protein/permease [Cyanobacteria bacterium]|nr:ABC transporter ATP-binding protein/permease [Cyanobacteriota bacterium]